MSSKKVIIDFEDNRFTRVTRSVLMDESFLDKPVQKLVYAVLCMYAGNKSKRAHPSIQTIADKCRCSPNTVRSALSRLEELDLIGVVSRKNGNRHYSNEYFLWVPPAWFDEGGSNNE